MDNRELEDIRQFLMDSHKCWETTIKPVIFKFVVRYVLKLMDDDNYYGNAYGQYIDKAMNLIEICDHLQSWDTYNLHLDVEKAVVQRQYEYYTKEYERIMKPRE